MAPRTRGANATTDSTPNDAIDGTDSPATTPGRRVHRCTKCKRPKAGHPRTGCPYVGSPAEGASPTNSPGRKVAGSAPTTPGRRSLAPNNLADALGSMQIRPTTPLEAEEELKATRRARRRSQPMGLQAHESLHSLSASSKDIVELLLKPGILGEDTEPEDNGAPAPFMVKGNPGRIIRWEDTVQAPQTSNLKVAVPQSRPKSSPQNPMPGTLFTPNPSFFDSQMSMPFVKEEEKPRILDSSPNISYASQFLPQQSPSAYKPKPLARSMSADQRDFFVSQLGTSSRATIHVLPKATVEAIAEEARDMGLLADIVMNDDEEDSQALLLVGRDDNEMDRLLARVQIAGQGKLQEHSSEKTSAATGESRSRRLRAVAGGAVVGAVGAWAGLAFS